MTSAYHLWDLTLWPLDDVSTMQGTFTWQPFVKHTGIRTKWKEEQRITGLLNELRLENISRISKSLKALSNMFRRLLFFFLCYSGFSHMSSDSGSYRTTYVLPDWIAQLWEMRRKLGDRSEAFLASHSRSRAYPDT